MPHEAKTSGRHINHSRDVYYNESPDNFFYARISRQTPAPAEICRRQTPGGVRKTELVSSFRVSRRLSATRPTLFWSCFQLFGGTYLPAFPFVLR